MKLQEAYAAEQNKIGSWAEIGYKDPSGSSDGGNTTNFAYGSGTAGSDDWYATSRVGLNDCQVGSKWFMGSSYASSTGNVTFVPDFTPKGDDCTVDGLTPNFKKIGAASN